MIYSPGSSERFLLSFWRAVSELLQAASGPVVQFTVYSELSNHCQQLMQTVVRWFVTLFWDNSWPRGLGAEWRHPQGWPVTRHRAIVQLGGDILNRAEGGIKTPWPLNTVTNTLHHLVKSPHCSLVTDDGFWGWGGWWYWPGWCVSVFSVSMWPAKEENAQWLCIVTRRGQLSPSHQLGVSSEPGSGRRKASTNHGPVFRSRDLSRPIRGQY